MFKKGGYILRGRGRSWSEKRGRVDSRSAALYKKRLYSGREGEILGGSHIDLRCLKGGVYSGMEAYNLGGSHIDV